MDFTGWRLSRILSFFERSSILSDCSAYIVPSKFVKKKLEEIGVKKEIFVVPHGREYEKFPEKIEARKFLNLPEDKKIVGFVGRISKGKGIIDLIDAWKIVSEKNKNSMLLVVGPNQDVKVSGIKGMLDDLQKKIRDESMRIKITGAVEEELMPYYISSMDIYVSPSINEGFGLSILNAMSAGKPVIAYNTTAIPELVDDKNGILVEPNDIKKLSNSILYLIENEKESEILGRNGLEKSMKYSWDKSIEEIIKIYNLFL